MSDHATVHFLPWMQRGLARALTGTADTNGVPTGASGTVEAAVTVSGTEVTRSIQVRGPGAVVGLRRTQIVREHPIAGTADFEVNLFPAVELAAPDLPWMLTPAAPNGDKLMPWLVLVVVEDRDGVEVRDDGDALLPTLHIDDARRELPDLREAWAWAHVQSTAPITGGVDRAVAKQPEAFVARLLCPRRLQVQTRYIACLVPAFEQGRRAGLGLDIVSDDLSLAWSDGTRALTLPVYHRWYFRTARKRGDFESLVKQLTARPLDSSVGVRGLDIGSPGSSKLPQTKGKTVGFLGALVSPTVEQPVWSRVHRQRFQRQLRELLNQPHTASSSQSTNSYNWRTDDPVVAPPAYGALAAGVDTVPSDDIKSTPARPAWMADVNLDPAQRAVAGLGSEVVRRNQERLIASAWDQAAGLRDVNRVLNQSRLALEVGQRLKKRIDAWDDGALLQLSRGAHARLKNASMEATLHGRLRQSLLPDGLVSGAFRRRVRPGTILARSRSQVSASKQIGFASVVTQQFVNNPLEKLDYARFTVPYGVVFDVGSSEASAEAADTRALVRAVERAALTTGTAMQPQGALIRRSHAATRRVASSERRVRRAVTSASPMSDAMAAASAAPVEWILSDLPVARDTSPDSALALSEVAATVREKLDPGKLLSLRVRALITAPEGSWGDADVPASMWIEPSFSEPMSALLAQIDPRFLLPGVGNIPDDTVGLAQVNQRFVEAFLLGANHELSREFIWREYPADPAGTWLRAFWDTAGATDETGAPIEDIPRVAEWDHQALGTHHTGTDPGQMLVLIVKGDLLRQYPNTLIYATPGIWKQIGSSSDWERVEDPGGHPLYPSFVGTLGRGVAFLGFQFDRGIDVATDVFGSSNRLDGRAGWFFAFEQPATEPRFGLDIGQPFQAGRTPRWWKDASWFHALGEVAEDIGGKVNGKLNGTATHVPLSVLNGTKLRFDDKGENTWTETWGRDAAAMARITLQRPIRMLVHADLMLKSPQED